MNKKSLITKIACWIGYCLFAGYSAYMTAKSVSMTYEMKHFWIVFIFVFVVALIAGFCLSTVIGELQNRINPSKGKFIGGLLGFLLFWGVSFMTNVHYMFMKDDGLKVVSAELGNYKSYIEDQTTRKVNEISDQEHDALQEHSKQMTGLRNDFSDECDKSWDPGFGRAAVEKLKNIENYLVTTASVYDDRNSYEGTIWREEYDKGYIGTKGKKQVANIKAIFTSRINEKDNLRKTAIKEYYNRKLRFIKDYVLIRDFINDSLYIIDLPQLTEIATPDVYYQFQKIQLHTNIHDRLDKNDQMEIERLTKVSKTDNPQDIEKGKFRYRIYPSSRMFNTWNVWEDMFGGRLPKDMKLLGMILLSLIVDIIAYVLRILAR